jgi:hypothetical protein
MYLFSSGNLGKRIFCVFFSQQVTVLKKRCCLFLRQWGRVYMPQERKTVSRLVFRSCSRVHLEVGREEAWLCDGSVMLEGLEALIESFFEAIL